MNKFLTLISYVLFLLFSLSANARGPSITGGIGENGVLLNCKNTDGDSFIIQKTPAKNYIQGIYVPSSFDDAIEMYCIQKKFESGMDIGFVWICEDEIQFLQMRIEKISKQTILARLAQNIGPPQYFRFLNSLICSYPKEKFE